MRSIKSKSAVFAAILSIGFFLGISAITARAVPVMPKGPITTATIPKGITVCLQDPNTFNYIFWNTTTGAYTFQQCSSEGPPISGTGTVKVVDNVEYLTDNETTIKVSAAYSNNQLTGTATVMLNVAKGVWQTVRINSTEAGAPCVCEVEEAPSGSVGILVFLVLVLSWLAFRIFRARRTARSV